MPVVNRRAFIASAGQVFLIIAAPFELVAFALMLLGSNGFPWWRLAIPNVMSLVIGLVIISGMPTIGIGILARSVGVSCVFGVVVIAAAVCGYLVALTKLSGMPAPLSSQVEFIGVVSVFSIPFGLLSGLFFCGAAAQSGSQSTEIDSKMVSKPR